MKDSGESSLWRMLGLVLTQFDGIVAGYQARQAADPDEVPHLSRRDLIFLNGNGVSPTSTTSVEALIHQVAVIRAVWD